MRVQKANMPLQRQTLIQDLITAAKAFDAANEALADYEELNGLDTHQGRASFGPVRNGDPLSPLNSQRLSSWTRDLQERGFSFA